MTTRRPCPPAPGPLEDYASQFDPLFSSLAQRRGLRDYLQGLLLPRDRNKTLTGLAGAEPITGAQHRQVQRLQWFLSESTWDHQAVNQRRIELLCADPVTAPHEQGVLVIDDTGDRKDGTHTALRHKSRIAETPHQLHPGTCHAGGVPTGLLRLGGEPVAGHRRDHHIERVRGVAAMRRRVGERAGDVQHLDDRARPAVRDDQRQRVLVRRPDVDEVDVQAVDLGHELRQGVQPRLEPPEVVLGLPVLRESCIVANCTPCD
jgi:hypothetical protein